MLRGDTDTILDVNRERAATILHESLAPGALDGYWILAPGNPMWRAPHQQLNLLPCSRIRSVAGNTIDSLAMLVSLSESGFNYLDSRNTFRVSLKMSRGMFVDVNLELISKENP